MTRWNWKLYLLWEAIAFWEAWVPKWDNPRDITHQLTETLYHMLLKAFMIRRAHR